jgi:hypothetical protein
MTVLAALGPQARIHDQRRIRAGKREQPPKLLRDRVRGARGAGLFRAGQRVMNEHHVRVAGPSGDGPACGRRLDVQLASLVAPLPNGSGAASSPSTRCASSAPTTASSAKADHAMHRRVPRRIVTFLTGRSRGSAAIGSRARCPESRSGRVSFASCPAATVAAAGQSAAETQAGTARADRPGRVFAGHARPGGGVGLWTRSQGSSRW